MKYLLFMLAALLVARASGQAIPDVPAISPISWQTDETRPSNAGDFSPRRNWLGSSKQPTSLKVADLQDARPYGEEGHRTVWLARYESVRVPAPDSSTSAAITLTLAFDVGTSELLCAFTEPAPHWARSSLGYGDLESRASKRWNISPARYEDLRSTLTEVLVAVQRSCGVDVSRAGQIVIRPRLVGSKLLKTNPRSADLPPLPPDPPRNMWVIEVLGTFIMERYGETLTTQIAMLGDGDLEYSGGMYLP